MVSRSGRSSLPVNRARTPTEELLRAAWLLLTRPRFRPQPNRGAWDRQAPAWRAHAQKRKTMQHYINYHFRRERLPSILNSTHDVRLAARSLGVRRPRLTRPPVPKCRLSQSSQSSQRLHTFRHSKTPAKTLNCKLRNDFMKGAFSELRHAKSPSLPPHPSLPSLFSRQNPRNATSTTFFTSTFFEPRPRCFSINRNAKTSSPTASRRKTWLRPDVGSGKFRVLIV